MAYGVVFTAELQLTIQQPYLFTSFLKAAGLTTDKWNELRKDEKVKESLHEDWKDYLNDHWIFNKLNAETSFDIEAFNEVLQEHIQSGKVLTKSFSPTYTLKLIAPTEHKFTVKYKVQIDSEVEFNDADDGFEPLCDIEDQFDLCVALSRFFNKKYPDCDDIQVMGATLSTENGKNNWDNYYDDDE